MSRYELQSIDPDSEYLENAWYVVARSTQIDQQLQSIKILGDNLLFYRDSKDQIVALEDACPHRKMPLSMGKRVGDSVQCGYHGLTFDALASVSMRPRRIKFRVMPLSEATPRLRSTIWSGYGWVNPNSPMNQRCCR